VPTFTFQPGVVLTEATGSLAIGATGVLRTSDNGFVSPVYDMNGSSLSNITVGPKGAHQAFKADIAHGVLDFGSVLLPVISQEAASAALETLAAASAASASASAAEVSAAAAAESVRGTYANLDADTAALIGTDTTATRAALQTLIAGSGGGTGTGGGTGPVVTDPFPTDITGLVARYQGDQLGDIGTTIEDWPDAAGATEASQTDAAKRPVVAAGPNGTKAAAFTGDYLSMPLEVRQATAGATGVTAFVVAMATSVGTGTKQQLFLSSGVDAGATRFGMNLGNSNNSLAMAVRRLDTDSVAVLPSDSSGTPTANQWFAATGWISYTTGTATTQLNGVTLGNGTWTTGTISMTDSVAGAIGAKPGGAEPWVGSIAEVIVFNRPLTTTEQARVYAYLRDKYALGSTEEPAIPADPTDPATPTDPPNPPGDSTYDPDTAVQVTSTKEIGTSAYTRTNFHATLSGTMIKVGAVAAHDIVITDGVADNIYRIVDQTSNDGSLDGLTIQRVTAKGRRGFAKIRSARNVLIEDCVGIGQGDIGTTESFPTGFQTENAAVDNLIIRRTRFEQWWSSDRTASYRNGDAFATEEAVTNCLFEDCVGSHNADGGFDLKGDVRVVRCLAEDNHRNLRLWGKFAVTDFTSINPRNAHIWLGGGTRLQGGTITRPTFVGGSSKPHIKIDSSSGPATVTIIDPVFPSGESLRVEKEGGSQVTVVVQYTKDGGVVATRPINVA